MSTVSKILDELFDNYLYRVQESATRVFFNKVVPYLDRHGYGFGQCNGDWWIIYQGKTYHCLSMAKEDAEYLLSYRKEGRELYELLNIEVPGQPTGSLANFMPESYEVNR